MTSTNYLPGAALLTAGGWRGQALHTIGTEDRGRTKTAQWCSTRHCLPYMPCTSRIPARVLLVQASASLRWSLVGEWTRKSLLAWAPVWEPEPRWYSAWLWELEWALVWGPRWMPMWMAPQSVLMSQGQTSMQV